MSEKMMLPGISFGITIPPDLAVPSVHRQIVDFVEGRNDGAELMLALYDDVGEEETLPPRLAALLRSWRQH